MGTTRKSSLPGGVKGYLKSLSSLRYAAEHTGRDEALPCRQRAKMESNSEHQREKVPRSSGSITVLTVIIVIAVLYFARVVFVPLALAVLISFLLGPLVARLRRWGLGGLTSTLIVVTVGFMFAVALAGLMSLQLADLAKRLPEYRQNVKEKMADIRSSGGGIVTRITTVVHTLSNDLVPPAAKEAAGPPEDKPVPVEIREAPFSPMELFQKVLGSLLEFGVTAGIVVVFVIFMLAQREDLRDRFLRLLGAGRVNLTTRAIDDATSRMSRYLVAQFILNISYGIPVGIGLYFIGVPNPILWGILAGLLRYIPYLGIWVAALMPAALAFAVDPGWTMLPLIFVLFFGVDLIMYNFAEPLLYGSSTGMSPMAILVATVFWTWLWGPVGLLLATPLTVCVVVVGRHVPSLEFLSVLLSDEPVLTPQTRFYQRMLAMDVEEASELAKEYLQDKPLIEFYDRIAIPALSLAEEDRHRGRLDEERKHFIIENTRLLISELSERPEKAGGPKEQQMPRGPQSMEEILCLPARDEADELASIMLAQLLEQRGLKARALPTGSLAGESLQEVSRSEARIICVAAVPPFGFMHARYLCRRLRAHNPQLKLVAAFLTEGDINEVRRREPAIPADEVAVNMTQAIAAVVALASSTTSPANAPSVDAAPVQP